MTGERVLAELISDEGMKAIIALAHIGHADGQKHAGGWADGNHRAPAVEMSAKRLATSREQNPGGTSTAKPPLR